MNNPIFLKSFIGCVITQELKFSLQHNKLWKQATNTETSPLIEIYHAGKNYLGQYLPNQVSMSELQQIRETTLEAIIFFCPQLNRETITLYIFPQVFIQ